MTTWIIAYSKDGNTSILRTDSPEKPDVDQAVRLVSEKAEADYADEAMEIDETAEQSPATRLADRFGITITGISQA